MTAAIAAALATANAIAGAAVDISALEDGGRYDRFIVKFSEGSVELANPALVRRAAQSAAGRAAPGAAAGKGGLQVSHLRRLGVGADVVRTNQKLDRNGAEALMRELAANPGVEYVEVDARMRAYLTPNDPGYPLQIHYHQAKGGLGLPWAWNRSTGSGVVVAVLDTGITSHSDLNANIRPGYDFIADIPTANDGNGRDSNPADPGDWTEPDECAPGDPGSDSSWHGTHVTGTVAAVTNNNGGVAGVAFGAKVVPARVLGKCGGFLSDIADAIVWASGGSVSGVPANANPADVINMSLGGAGACGSTYQTAINGAVGRGTVVVVAAGNDNDDVAFHRPANCGNVISVAATDPNGRRAGYSNYGDLIDVAAPGGSGLNPAENNILSTWNAGFTVPAAEEYAWNAGTSMAAPHVAGAVALMDAVSNKTPSQLEALLKGSTRPFPLGYCSNGCGTGIVNAEAAVNAARGLYYKNDTDVIIGDNTTITSTIVVGRAAQAPSTLRVSVYLTHGNVGQLKVDLLAPDGTVYTVHNRTPSANPYINLTYTVNASSEWAYGGWKLRINDNAGGSTGTLRKWTLSF